MEAPERSAEEVIPLNQAIAYIVGCLTIVLAPLGYWQYGGDLLLGEHSFAKLLAISGVGGAVCFVLWAERGMRLLALLPGLATGAGAGAALQVYAQAFGKTSLWTGEIFLVEMVGALPGILLMVALVSWWHGRTVFPDPT